MLQRIVLFPLVAVSALFAALLALFGTRKVKAYRQDIRNRATAEEQFGELSAQINALTRKLQDVRNAAYAVCPPVQVEDQLLANTVIAVTHAVNACDGVLKYIEANIKAAKDVVDSKSPPVEGAQETNNMNNTNTSQGGSSSK